MRNAFRDFFRRRRVSRHLAGNGPVFEYHGLKVTIPPEAGLSAMNALLRGKYERDEAALILRHLPSDRPVIELGGSLGVVSALVASRLEPGTPHMVVEANEDLVSACRANAGGGATVVHAALAYQAAVVRFRIGADIHASALDAGLVGGELRDVPAVTLSELLDRIGDPRSFVLVADIEGAEFAMFEREALALSRCVLAIVEIHPGAFASSGHSEDDFMALAGQAGLVAIDRSADVVVLARRDQPSGRSGVSASR